MWQEKFLKPVTPVRWSITDVTRLKTLTPCSVVQEVTGVSRPSAEPHCFAGAMSMCGVLQWIPVSPYPVTFAPKLVLLYLLLLCKHFASARLRNMDHCSINGSVTNCANSAQQFRRRCSWSRNVKIDDQPSFCGHLVAQEAPFYCKPHNSFNRYSLITWRLCSKHTQCRFNDLLGAVNDKRMESRMGQNILHPSRPALGLPVQCVTGIFPEGKAAGVLPWQPTPSSAEVKEEKSCTLLPIWAIVTRYRLKLTLTQQATEIVSRSFLFGQRYELWTL
jgi:hypothetical protein